MPGSYAYLRLWLAVGWGLVALVVILSLIPMPERAEVRYLDKLEHALAYFTMTAWFCQIYPRRWRVALALVGLGALLEILQGLTGYRQMSFKDGVANALGVGLGLLFTRYSPGLLQALETWLRRLRGAE